MKTPAIRAGKPSDATGIAALINREIRSGLAIWRYAERTEHDIKDMLSDRIAAGYALYVAEVNDKIVGWAGYGPFRTGEGYAQTMEHSVHVTPDYRRQGIASSLLSKVIEHAENAGIHCLIGAIAATNDASLEMHKRFGFVEVGRLPEVGWKFDKWLTLVLMQRTYQS